MWRERQIRGEREEGEGGDGEREEEREEEEGEREKGGNRRLNDERESCYTFECTSC